MTCPNFIVNVSYVCSIMRPVYSKLEINRALFLAVKLCLGLSQDHYVKSELNKLSDFLSSEKPYVSVARGRIYGKSLEMLCHGRSPHHPQLGGSFLFSLKVLCESVESHDKAPEY